MREQLGVDQEGLDLADAIALLREQVVEARERITAEGDQEVRFGLGEITVELGLELARTRGANAGLRFSVIGLGGKQETTRAASHKVTVRLSPHTPTGEGVDISDAESSIDFDDTGE